MGAVTHILIPVADIVGFTPLSSSLPTAEVFMLLSNMFNTFDRLTDQFGVYKVGSPLPAVLALAGHIVRQLIISKCCISRPRTSAHCSHSNCRLCGCRLRQLGTRTWS